MKTRDYVIGLVLLACSAITISLFMKSCELSEEKQLKKENQVNEATIGDIQAKRNTNNAAVITDSNRAKVVDSVNTKNGLDLSVRKSKGN